jgi:excisionase family DNA binding protein
MSKYNSNILNSESVEVVPDKLAYSPREAAIKLGVCQDTIYRLLKRGLLRSSTALRHKLIPHSELVKFLNVTLN